jgi:hypothetical protein
MLENVVIANAGGPALLLSDAPVCVPAEEPSSAALTVGLSYGSYVPSADLIKNTRIENSAGQGVLSKWIDVQGGPDLTASNTFVDLVGCAQTLPLASEPGLNCADSFGCLVP